MSDAEGNLVSDLLASIGNEVLSDLVLIGTDGVRVPAFRYILGARSKVFERMLFGNFKESRQDDLPLGYTGAVLHALMEFCCSDNLPSFEYLTSKPNEQVARDVVQLCTAAHYFELPRLCRKAFKLACSLMDEHPSLACAVYDEANRTATTEAPFNYALETIRKKPRASLLSENASCCGGGVSSLTAAKVGVLIKDNEIIADELTIFTALQKWTTSIKGEERIKRAKEFVVNIDLSNIARVDLLGVVRDSGLVEQNQIMEALAEQVQKAERQGVSITKKHCRGQPNVIVEGAGVSEANGAYIVEGELNGSPKYKRRGRWNNEDVTFSIYMCEKGAWFISMDSGASRTFQGQGRHLILYSNRRNKRQELTYVGWETTTPSFYARNPPPTTSHVYAGE